ncbi:hypothetical protein [Streptomyces exfoliatus]|uniref:hypothetical protein n=1 Tax=Streptomyces exfoliatus TaxID=1905 RepID=UPI003789FBEF
MTDHDLTITIKYGKGYEDTWAVFKGTSEAVRDRIIRFYGFRPEMVADLTDSELVVEATNIAHGKGNLAAFLGATTIGVEKTDRPRTNAARADDPWAAASASPPTQRSAVGDTADWILGEIEKAAELDDLKKLWAANQSLFADPGVMAAYKARGRALKSR